jgi:hypothetical protein
LPTACPLEGRRTPIFDDSMSQHACLVAAGCRFRVASMSAGAHQETKIESGGDLYENSGKPWQLSVKLGINRLFSKFTTGRMGTLRREIHKHATADFSRAMRSALVMRFSAP